MTMARMTSEAIIVPRRGRRSAIIPPIVPNRTYGTSRTTPAAATQAADPVRSNTNTIRATL